MVHQEHFFLLLLTKLVYRSKYTASRQKYKIDRTVKPKQETSDSGTSYETKKFWAHVWTMRMTASYAAILAVYSTVVVR